MGKCTANGTGPQASSNGKQGAGTGKSVRPSASDLRGLITCLDDEVGSLLNPFIEEPLPCLIADTDLPTSDISELLQIESEMDQDSALKHTPTQRQTRSMDKTTTYTPKLTKKRTMCPPGPIKKRLKPPTNDPIEIDINETFISGNIRKASKISRGPAKVVQDPDDPLNGSVVIELPEEDEAISSNNQDVVCDDVTGNTREDTETDPVGYGSDNGEHQADNANSAETSSEDVDPTKDPYTPGPVFDVPKWLQDHHYGPC